MSFKNIETQEVPGEETKQNKRGGSQSARPKRQLTAQSSAVSDQRPESVRSGSNRHRRNSSTLNTARPAQPSVFEDSTKESKYLEFLLRNKYNLYED